jgi:hypothetical protein
MSTEKLICWKIDSADPFRETAAMPAARRPMFKKLHLGEWLARLGKKPVDVARHQDVSESYNSNQISGKRENPSIDKLLAISEYLGITVNDLYRAPPPLATLKDLQGFSAGAIEQLMERPKQSR